MNLTPADKALAAGFAGQLEPAKKRQFVVTVIRGGQRHTWTEGYTSLKAAQDAGIDFLGTFHGVATARPLVELTEEEGARRFPQPLHKDAFTDAWRGYMAAEEEARAARLARGQRDDREAIERSYDWALVAQMSRPDELERAHRAAQGV
ncbi:MAG: hypothetical protein LCH79_15420 [Proteobacteria bacterium]|nr:hypothetical protein [Pseudomonadota bacterium]